MGYYWNMNGLLVAISKSTLSTDLRSTSNRTVAAHEKPPVFWSRCCWEPKIFLRAQVLRRKCGAAAAWHFEVLARPQGFGTGPTADIFTRILRSYWLKIEQKHIIHQLYWLVVWNMKFVFPIILGMSCHPNWRNHSKIFQRGWWLNHQPDSLRCFRVKYQTSSFVA